MTLENKELTFRPIDHFRCHPIRRANHGRPFATFGTDLSAESEIGQLDGAVHSEQNIVAFNITVDDRMAEKKLEFSPERHLLHVQTSKQRRKVKSGL